MIATNQKPGNLRNVCPVWDNLGNKAMIDVTNKL